MSQDPCRTCQGNFWIADENWQPETHELGRPRTPGSGLIPCGDCNAGNWDGPLPYPGWPGPCREYACDDVTHPCALFHDPTACERRTPIDGCGCDLEHLISTQPTAPDTDEEPDPADDLGPEPEWCPHHACYDRVHVDGLHTDEDGRPFRGTPDPVHEPHELVYDDDPDTTQDYDEQAVQWPADVIAKRPPRQASPTPIYDQLVAELITPKVHR